MVDPRDIVSVERVIASPPGPIFELLACPRRHAEIDGSGSVQGLRADSPARLAPGSKFSMSMRIGLPYSMVNEVVEFEEGRRIAWSARPPGFLGRLAGGRTWRYELEVSGDGTRVRESWDISTDKQRHLLRLWPIPRQTREAMDKTLRRIEEIVTSRGRRTGPSA